MSPFIRRTTALAGADFTQALRSETHAPTEGAEDFGCGPFVGNGKCRRHCRNTGRRDGYCMGMFKQTCKCHG
ncbi:actinodefensin [Actinomyces wuliandei]|uniref:actinodefensin n=1 Tax=Actinomyces wuliandei TaxID=2057743 RepID=UPI000FD7FBC7|nr:actinodefensin [Actinomyces wuliandei]